MKKKLQNIYSGTWQLFGYREWRSDMEVLNLDKWNVDSTININVTLLFESLSWSSETAFLPLCAHVVFPLGY